MTNGLPPSGPGTSEDVFHACFSGNVQCTGVNPCPDCKNINHAIVYPMAFQLMGIDPAGIMPHFVGAYQAALDRLHALMRDDPTLRAQYKVIRLRQPRLHPVQAAQPNLPGPNVAPPARPVPAPAPPTAPTSAPVPSPSPPAATIAAPSPEDVPALPAPEPPPAELVPEALSEKPVRAATLPMSVEEIAAAGYLSDLNGSPPTR